MKTSQVWSKQSLAAALLCLAGFAAPVAVVHAQTAAAQPAPPPPELEKLEEGEPPAVTIRKPGDGANTGNSIKERRDHGDTKEVEVKSGPSTYTVRPKGNNPGDNQSTPPNTAQWKIGEFDWGVKKKDGDKSGDADAGSSK